MAETEEQINKGPQIQDDEIGQLTVEQMQENLKKDVEAYTKSLEDINKSLSRYKEQWEVDRKMWDIIKSDHVKLEPEFGYEANEEYWKLRLQKLMWKIEEDTFVAEKRMKHYSTQIEETQKALDGAKEKLSKFGGN